MVLWTNAACSGCWGSTGQRFQVELTKTVTDGSPRITKDTKYVTHHETACSMWHITRQRAVHDTSRDICFRRTRYCRFRCRFRRTRYCPVCTNAHTQVVRLRNIRQRRKYGGTNSLAPSVMEIKYTFVLGLGTLLMQDSSVLHSYSRGEFRKFW